MLISLRHIISASLLGWSTCTCVYMNDMQKYNEILGLKSKGLKADVLLAIGYRSDEDKTKYDVKIRKPKESIFEIV